MFILSPLSLKWAYVLWLSVNSWLTACDSVNPSVIKCLDMWWFAFVCWLYWPPVTGQEQSWHNQIVLPVEAYSTIFGRFLKFERWRVMNSRGSLETHKQWWGQRGTYFSSYSPHFLNHQLHHPAAVLSHPQIPSKFLMLTIPQCPDAVLWPFTPLNPELSFITFLWSWEWKRWDKGEKGGAESNMAAYLEDFLY